MNRQKFIPNKVSSYFKAEWAVLLAVTVSGLIYNLGLLAGPWFEGRMTGCLIDILNGRKTFYNMPCIFEDNFATGLSVNELYKKKSS